MAKFNSRGARLTALALATGTLIVAGTGSAGANPVAVPDVFGGTAQGTAIHLEINLPQAIPTNVPVLGGITSLVQDISFTEGNTAKGISPTTTSVAKAVLGNGNVVALSDLLNLKVQSSLDGAHEASDAILAQDLGLIKVGVGQIASSVAPDSATSALTSSSSSSLVSLEVGLASLPELPVKADLNAVVETLNNTVDEAQGSVTQVVNNALATLDEATQGAAAPVVAQVDALKQQITDLLDALQSKIANLSADTSLVKLGLLKSTENITRAGSMVTAKATSEVGGLSILGDLVTIDAVDTQSVSSANGTKGAAAADTRTKVVGLKVADLLDLSLSSTGLEGTLMGNEIPQVAKDAVKTVIDAVNGVLLTAGVQIVNGKTETVVDPAGKFARSSSEGVGIVVNPLKAAKPLVLVQLVPAGTAVNADHTKKNVNTPKVPLVKTPTDETHPRTGVELPLFAVLGTGLAGAALVARRRRTVEA